MTATLTSAHVHVVVVAAAAAPRTGCKVVQIGAGQIGSMAFGLLARQSAITELLLIDPQRYGVENLLTQNIAQDDVGEPKAVALARQAMRIRPRGDLTVRSIVDRIENVAWGVLRDADLICAAVDSREARCWINFIAHRLGGIPWIDAGVRADGMLARVNVYFPGADSPCLECSMGPRDYELLNQSYSCDGKLKPAPATNSPVPLGALAGAMLALEAQKFFAGEIDRMLIGRQWVLEARHHQHFLNTLRRNSDCRFDHEIWSIERIDAPLRTMADLAEHVRPLLGDDHDNAEPALAVDRHPWVTRLACPHCGRQARTRCLQRRLTASTLRCQTCRDDANPMVAMGFYLQPQLPLRSSSEELHRTGLRSGEVVSLVTPRGRRHVELTHIIGGD